MGADSGQLTVAPGPPASISIISQPFGTAAAVVLSVQPRVAIVDLGGNILELAQPIEVTASLVAGGPTQLPSDRAVYLTGSKIVYVRGQGQDLTSSFSNLAVMTSSLLVAIRFEAALLSAAVSNSFLLAPAAPDHLVITVHPLNGMAATPVQPQPVVEIHDVGGNLVPITLPGLEVTAKIRNGGSTSGAQVAVVNGVATFRNFAVMEAQDCLVLEFQTCKTDVLCPTPLPAVSTNTLSVVRGFASRLELLQQPEGASPGSALDTQPIVGVIDAGSNVVVLAQESLGSQIRCVGPCKYLGPHVDKDLSPLPSPASEASPPRNLGSSLLASMSGVALMTDVRIDRAGGPFELHFFRLAGGFSTATSLPFFIPPGDPYGPPNV